MNTKMIKLAEATIDEKDMDALASWISTYPQLTKGPLTLEYESLWSRWLGVAHSTFVNSGSSANLLMLATLMEAGDLEPGDKVIVPALSWATDLSPVMQLGLTPVLCDCNLQDFSISIDYFNKLIADHNPKALILVSVLGLPPKMPEIVKICKDNNVILLEDCCESLGSGLKGIGKLGTFGAMSTFSTYFGHHISTIEGGMVCTGNDRYHRIMQSVRSHGWSRDWSKEDREEHCKEWGVSEFNSLYTFFHAGFNIRATDLQAFLGIRQLSKLQSICSKREANFNLYRQKIHPNLKRQTRLKDIVSNFAYPLIYELSEQRDSLAALLSKEGVECRPLICGSMGTQPFYVKKYGKQSMPFADTVRDCGMYLPNHHLMTEEDIDKVCDIVNRHYEVISAK